MMIDPLIGFDGIHFSPVAEGGVLTDWEVRPIWARRKVAGSNVVKRQFLQYDADRLYLRLLLPTTDTYTALVGTIGTTATLTLIPQAVITAPASRQEHILGVDYVHFPLTTLTDVTESRRLRDGRALCTATFERDHETGVP